jgi:hypothetical protein
MDQVIADQSLVRIRTASDKKNIRAVAVDRVPEVQFLYLRLDPPPAAALDKRQQVAPVTVLTHYRWI